MIIVVGIVPFAFGLLLLCGWRLTRWWTHELRLDIESVVNARRQPPRDTAEDLALQARLLERHKAYYRICRLLALRSILPTTDQMIGSPRLDGRPTIAKVATRIVACAIGAYCVAIVVGAVAPLVGHEVSRVVTPTFTVLFVASSVVGPLRWIGGAVLPAFGLAYSWYAYARIGGEIPVQPNTRSVIAAYVALTAFVAAWPSASRHHHLSYAICAVAFTALVAWAGGSAATRLARDLLFARRGDYARHVRLVIPGLGESCTGPDGFNWDVLSRRVRRMNPGYPATARRSTKRAAAIPQRPSTKDLTAPAVRQWRESPVPVVPTPHDHEPRVVAFCGRLFINVDNLRPPDW